MKMLSPTATAISKRYAIEHGGNHTFLFEMPTGLLIGLA
jgi:hypothetical protein